MTRCTHKSHSHIGRMLLNPPENRAKSQSHRTAWFMAPESFTVTALWYNITHMFPLFMPCILQRSLRQLNNPSSNLSPGIFNAVRRGSVFQGSLGRDAEPISALHHRAVHPHLWRRPKAIRIWAALTEQGLDTATFRQPFNLSSLPSAI